MKRYVVFWIVIVSAALALGIKPLYAQISWQEIGQGNMHIQTVLAEKETNKVLFIGTKNSILKTTDGGLNWRVVFSLRGENSRINLLLSDDSAIGKIYAATANGLFCSLNHGKDWKRIFKGKNILENECTVLTTTSEVIYLGTAKGLFISKDNGNSWKKESGEIGNSRILSIANNPKEVNQIYVLAVGGLFKFKNKVKTWEKIFSAQTKEGSQINDSNSEDELKDERISTLRHVAIEPGDSSHLYLATSKGIYKSSNSGLDWESLTNYGLLSKDANFVLFSQARRLYVLTKSGLFEFNNQRWIELTFNLLAEEFNYLTIDKTSNIYLACDKGLFKANANTVSTIKIDMTLSSYSTGEPNINQVQEAAIQYAEVDAEKIKRWRIRATNKAWLPNVNCGINRDVTALWHWEGGSTTKSDDDTLRRGRDSLEWDVSLSWDLSELIWNKDQTSIDVRSKLMVELRDDLLDEVTKLYYERLRVKIELDNVSIEDRKKLVELRLRLDELTASLDALTAGYFSQNIKSRP